VSDKRLIDDLREGCSAAWSEMVQLYLKLVYHVVRKTLSLYGRTGGEQDVEDVTNDLFQSLIRDNYRALGTIGEPYDLKAWLAVSARRRAIDFVRKKRLESVSLDESKEGDEVTRGAAVAVKETGEEDSAREEYKNAVNESLASLNPKERLVVQLFYLKGKKYREIAALTGINQNSISPTLARAVEKMQKYLEDRNLLST
jgi:RNA polymerase sigma-70 factor (ECF subfamily)